MNYLCNILKNVFKYLINSDLKFKVLKKIIASQESIEFLRLASH